MKQYTVLTIKRGETSVLNTSDKLEAVKRYRQAEMNELVTVCKVFRSDKPNEPIAQFRRKSRIYDIINCNTGRNSNSDSLS